MAIKPCVASKPEITEACVKRGSNSRIGNCSALPLAAQLAAFRMRMNEYGPREWPSCVLLMIQRRIQFMTALDRATKRLLIAALGAALLLAGDRSASAQGLLAQGGVAKTMIGWLLVLLLIGLGLVVVGRPSSRKPPEEKKK